MRRRYIGVYSGVEVEGDVSNGLKPGAWERDGRSPPSVTGGFEDLPCHSARLAKIIALFRCPTLIRVYPRPGMKCNWVACPRGKRHTSWQPHLPLRVCERTCVPALVVVVRAKIRPQGRRSNLGMAKRPCCVPCGAVPTVGNPKKVRW